MIAILVAVFVFLELAALALLPFVLEWIRLPMNEVARADAPGYFAALPRGLTHYRYFGENKKAPLVVCIHGLTTPSFVFEAMAARIAKKGARVLVYDHYGRGYSARPQGRQDCRFFTAHLAALLKKLGENKRPIILIGYSMGGRIAAGYAAAYPEQVRRLILLAPSGMGHVLWPAFERLQKIIPPLAGWLFMLSYPAMLRNGIESERAVKKHVPFISERQHRELLYRGFLPAVLASMRGAISEDAEADHRKIAVAGIPVTAIWGEDDNIIPLAASEKLARWNPEADNIVIAGGGHGIAYTHPAGIVNAMKVEV